MNNSELGKYRSAISRIFDIQTKIDERKRLQESNQREEKRRQEAEKPERQRDEREIIRDKKNDKSNRISLII